MFHSFFLLDTANLSFLWICVLPILIRVGLGEDSRRPPLTLHVTQQSLLLLVQKCHYNLVFSRFPNTPWSSLKRQKVSKVCMLSPIACHLHLQSTGRSRGDSPLPLGCSTRGCRSPLLQFFFIADVLCVCISPTLRVTWLFTQTCPTLPSGIRWSLSIILSLVLEEREALRPHLSAFSL